MILFFGREKGMEDSSRLRLEKMVKRRIRKIRAGRINLLTLRIIGKMLLIYMAFLGSSCQAANVTNAIVRIRRKILVGFLMPLLARRNRRRKVPSAADMVAAMARGALAK